MKNEELSKAIEEGIMNGFWKPLLYAVIGILIGLGILAVAILVTDWHFDSQNQGLTGTTTTGAARDCWPLTSVTCYFEYSNGTDKEAYDIIHVCGYQEAKAFYELKKPFVDEWMKEKDADGWSITGFKCD